MIDGIEYLVLQNDFRSIMKFIQLINEDVAISGSILILPVNPKALETKEMGYLERELQAYEHKD